MSATSKDDPHDRRKREIEDRMLARHDAVKTDADYRHEAETMAKATGHEWIYCPDHSPQTLTEIILNTIPLASLLKSRDQLEAVAKERDLQCTLKQNCIAQIETLRAENEALKRKLADAELPTLEHIQDIYALTKCRAERDQLKKENEGLIECCDLDANGKPVKRGATLYLQPGSDVLREPMTLKVPEQCRYCWYSTKEDALESLKQIGVTL